MVPAPTFPDLSSHDTVQLLDLVVLKSWPGGQAKAEMAKHCSQSEQPAPCKVSHGGNEEASVSWDFLTLKNQESQE